MTTNDPKEEETSKLINKVRFNEKILKLVDVWVGINFSKLTVSYLK